MEESSTPSPSWPELSEPQQRTSPPERRAQVWAPPAAIPVASTRPGTATGVALAAVVPLPSWPLSLAPQQRTVPVRVSAQVWAAPAATSSGVGDAVHARGR